MPQKIINTSEFGEVLVVKRRGMRHLRLRIKPNGQVSVSIPSWTPYQAGVMFALSRKAWIEKHRPAHTQVELKAGDTIGKTHKLELARGDVEKVKTRVAEGRVVITAPHTASSAQIQSAAAKAAERALKKEAADELPGRLEKLANQHNFSYKSVSVKRLTSRWGSCSNRGHITLNYFLMQLPWELIDYVLIHELVHTKHFNHSAKFWDEMSRHVVDPKQLQKTVRQYKTMILPG